MSERLDVSLVSRGLISTRSKAQQMIDLEMVMVDGKIINKSSYIVDESNRIELVGKLNFVGRGGEKLSKALRIFKISVKDRIALDVGASTGGFTDCLLQNGAKHVYAVDVGNGQLDESLKNNDKVTNMENTDIRDLKNEFFILGNPDIVTIDVSFISSLKILPYIKNLIHIPHDIILLIKPQFEGFKTKKGIVNNKKEHMQILEYYTDSISKIGYELISIDHSPILGGEGNIEFIAHLSSYENNEIRITIKDIVEEAYRDLKNNKH